MRKCTLLIGTAALSGLVAVSAPAMAQGYGNDAAAGANSQMSTQGSVNSNGVNATDRAMGQDRARERADDNSRLNRTARTRGANPTYSGAPPDHSQHDQAGSENSATPSPGASQ